MPINTLNKSCPPLPSGETPSLLPSLNSYIMSEYFALLFHEQQCLHPAIIPTSEADLHSDHRNGDNCSAVLLISLWKPTFLPESNSILRSELDIRVLLLLLATAFPAYGSGSFFGPSHILLKLLCKFSQHSYHQFGSILTLIVLIIYSASPLFPSHQ